MAFALLPAGLLKQQGLFFDYSFRKQGYCEHQ